MKREKALRVRTGMSKFSSEKEKYICLSSLNTFTWSEVDKDYVYWYINKMSLKNYAFL